MLWVVKSQSSNELDTWKDDSSFSSHERIMEFEVFEKCHEKWKETKRISVLIDDTLSSFKVWQHLSENSYFEDFILSRNQGNLPELEVWECSLGLKHPPPPASLIEK